MIRNIASIALFILMLIVSFYIKSQINAFNLNYYHGKDDGASVQLESIVAFGFLFFFLISRHSKMLYGFIGLIIGFMAGIICYLVFATEILFPVSASLLIVITFYLIEYISNVKNEKKANH